MYKNFIVGNKVIVEVKNGFHIIHIMNEKRIINTLEQCVLIKDGSARPFVETDPIFKPVDDHGVCNRIIIPSDVAAIIVSRYYDCNDNDEYHIIKILNGEVTTVLFSEAGKASEIGNWAGNMFYKTIARLTATDGWSDITMNNEEG